MMERFELRPATIDDAAEIARLGRLLYTELHYSKWVPYVEADVRETLVGLIDSGVLLIAVAPQIVGYIGVAIHPLYLNRSVSSAEEVFWWVDQEYRALGVGQALLEAAEHEAEVRGATFVSSMLNETAHGNGVGQFLESRGYELAERTFFKVL